MQKSLPRVADSFSLCNASALIHVTVVLRLSGLERAGQKAPQENMPWDLFFEGHSHLRSLLL